ncbi:hypothetical protein [Haliscomenobacter hydrossis]|uniref:Uncharacterized protein n=1 Tax=Haliscomenobacter hydrossis (strain ATCC 27775 / DSM 1100 / LMG 10767 / O) TaxID=760192 RepID=F4KVK9_HALH1|nr:hypothetical protein [Haliscomenobacter hydrossis]AEE52466.1 hypothetical protein Halhy_4630 [Haliscomenobacter hydrossis DSM 1100]
MNYQEQLLDIRWREKRMSIIQRDNWKCQNCSNESYKENYQYGLIFSNKLPHGASPTTYHKEKFITHIWDLKNNTIKIAFTQEPIFSPDKSYVAVYKEGKKHPQLLALKIIENEKIELNADIFAIITNGIKGKVSEKTFEEVYRPEREEDKWELVLGLHVHHKYYQNGLLAWQYPKEALITLCWECHEKLHSDTIIAILDSNGNEIGKLTPCRRCSGAGMFPEHVHVESGICFRCHGAKYEEMI